MDDRLIEAAMQEAKDTQNVNYWGRAAASHARADGTRVAGSFRRSEEP
jgi:hypothetical protein